MKNSFPAAGRRGRVLYAWLRCLLIIPMMMLGLPDSEASAQTQPPRVSLQAQNQTLAELFRSIQEQTDFSFVYNNSDVDAAQRISIEADKEPLNKVLKRIFNGSEIDFTVKDKHIILSKRQTPAPTKSSARGGVVSGSVKDSNGMPLIGASVVIQGTTVGAAVDVEGNFSLPQAKPGDILVVSLIGYEKLEIPASKSFMQIVLKEENELLDAVVVTALGIKREEKALTYNVQKVGGELVNTVKDANFVNSLAGKIAGLQINASASGTGGSTRVVMRGVKSISGNNNALYVIDGIPMPDLRASQTEGIFETPDGGDFEGISNLNPEDIESMSVLSGATAAALYGSQGANGVILITTKKGASGKIRVNFSNNTTFSSPFVLPEFQNTYGTSATAPSMSWGAKLDTPSSYDPRDFFQTGFNTTNSVAVSGGTERNQTYLSAATLNSRGTIPNNVYNRYNFTLRNTSQLVKDKLTLDLGASFMQQYSRNPLVQGLYHNPLLPIYLFPRGDDIRKYQIYERYDATVGYKKQFWPLEFITGVENPWWTTNRELFENTTQRYTFNATLKWDIADWISLMGRVRTDNTAMNYTRKIYASSNTLFASEYGNLLDHKVLHNNLYADALLSIDKQFLDDKLALQFNLGASLMDDTNNGSGFEGHLSTLPNKFSLYNIDMSHSQTKTYADRYHDQVQALYGTLQLGWNGMVYLDVTARNEWASQLAGTPHVNIFYPSVGLSAVISSMADLSAAGISFLKVRGSYAEVGNAPQRFITGVNIPLGTGGVISSSTYAPAVNLTPERTKSFEVGLNAKFLDNKIWLDATYYNTNTYNQLFEYDAPPSTGYKKAYINAGKINNWGIEAVVGYKNRWNHFAWSTNVNFSMNRNSIKELVPEGTRDVSGNLVDIDEVNMDYGGYRMKVKAGGSIGDFYVTGLKTDDYGRIYVDPNTNTVTTDPNTWIYGGNTEARFRLGWNNQFSFKGVSLGVLIDARIGGQGVSATQALLDRWGASKASADAREDNGVWISEDQKLPDVQAFYANNGNGMAMLSHYVYNMTNVRLRELSIGYDLPSKWFNNKIGMTVSLVGRNLWMIYNKAPFDPEITASTGTYYQGLDYFMQPSVRNLGFSVRLQF